MAVTLQAEQFEGVRPDPHLLITAGVHGDEHVPMHAVRELIRIFRDGTHHQSLCGKLTLVPVVNESAFARNHRCGTDDLDLARTCPGNPDGTVTEQTAHALSLLIQSADYYIDLHTGGTGLTVFPLAGYCLHPDEAILGTQRQMAKAFNLPFVWGTSAELEGRSLSVARDAKVPAIYVEYLGGLSPCTEGRTACVEGCLNVMSTLGMLDRDLPANAIEEVVEDSRPQSGHMQICNPAPMTGFLELLVELGQKVKTGDPIASIGSICGNRNCIVKSKQDGRVIVLRTYPVVNEGEAIGVVAERTE